jgi:hypothetical protein
MTKMARRWSRARMATLLLAAAALSDPAFAKVQDRGGFDPHNHLAQNVTPASRPGVAREAAATPDTAANELVRGLGAAWDGFERLPVLTTRRVLTTHSVIGAGEQGGCENVNGERS